MSRFIIKFQTPDGEGLVEASVPNWEKGDYIIRAATLEQATKQLERAVRKVSGDGPMRQVIDSVCVHYHPAPARGRVKLVTGQTFTLFPDVTVVARAPKKTEEEKKEERKNARDARKARIEGGVGSLLEPVATDALLPNAVPIDPENGAMNGTPSSAAAANAPAISKAKPAGTSHAAGKPAPASTSAVRKR